VGGDYGAVRTRRLGAIPLIGLAVALGGLAALLAVNWAYHRTNAIGVAQAWTIDGPPCPTLSRAAFVSGGHSAPRSFEYDGVVFGRQAGHVSCQDVAYGGGRGLGVFPVCQFTSPAVLTVKTRKDEVVYAPGVGQAATVAVQHGEPRCVLASKFTVNAPS
jgi:hypothetical protein